MIELFGLRFLPTLRAGVELLKGVLYLFPIIHKVQHKGVFFMRVDAIQAGQGLDGLNTGQPFVHIHGVQQGLVKAGLVFLRHKQDLVLVCCEPLRQLPLAYPAVHVCFGIGFLLDRIVRHDTGKRDQGFDRIALLRDVAIKALLVAHGLKTRARHHHGLGPAANLVAGEGLEMLDHDLGLLGDIVRMQTHKA